MLGIHGCEWPGRQPLAAWPPADLINGVRYGAAVRQGQGKFFTAQDFSVAAEEVNTNGE